MQYVTHVNTAILTVISISRLTLSLIKGRITALDSKEMPLKSTKCEYITIFTMGVTITPAI